MTVHAFTDGAARGNPGESGIGVIFKDEQGATLVKLHGYIGETTNNVAEYTALLACLKSAPKTKCSRLVVHSDSELMVRQVLGEYKVKDLKLKVLYLKVRRLLAAAAFEFEIKHVRRELNKEADELANLGIDSRKAIKV
ncbi:MAG: ribonuclease HI family protein [Ignavibacteriales bacterium]|nr:ribonuclease HI family protein [Ignavibacteriales bacterium]